jgi:hypothetical protein
MFQLDMSGASMFFQNAGPVNALATRLSGYSILGDAVLITGCERTCSFALCSLTCRSLSLQDTRA